MGNLFLNNDRISDKIAVSNYFIEEYMPRANGEFVKIYIHLLKCAACNMNDLSICSLADTFNCTESDVTRALQYWENLGLLTLTTNESTKKIEGISLIDCKPLNAPSSIKINTIEGSLKPSTISNTNKIEKIIKPQYTVDEIATFSSDEDVQQLLFIAEAYLGKLLTSDDTNTILYFYDTLGFSTDLIEYLIEYCVNNGKKRMRYIETVALKWAEENITTVDEAKNNTSRFSKQFYPIMKSMGIYDRSPAPAERDYIIKWNNVLGFSTEIIIEACNRTINTIHKPDFKYANSILENWKKSGIKSISDINILDTQFKKQSMGNKYSTQNQSATTNKFSNFNQRSYNYDELEKQLLSNHK